MIPPSNNKLRPQAHLINLIAQMREHQPAFTLFLGAGASVKSGVRAASSLIQEWQARYAAIYGSDSVDLAAHKGQPDEYSFLFEALFDHPSQRRNFIENCIKGASPSWGYIYLVNLINADVFNTVFTTNFDDLLNEACFAYSSSVRPVVCAHDSSIANIRIFSNRPKIVKLHGDFLFDSIKNTTVETKSLERNMQEKFNQYANEFGMIVVGYSGNDRSIMDPLEDLIEQGSAFPNGLYWCVRKGAPLSKYVQRLCRFPTFNLIEINGFDEFCADIHGALGLALQPELADPYSALTRRLDGLMRRMNLPDTGSTHPVIDRDVARLAEQLVGLAVAGHLQTDSLPVTQADAARLAGVGTRIPVPFVFLSSFFLRRGEHKRAQICAAAALQQEPSQVAFEAVFRVLGVAWDEKLADFANRLFERSTGLLDEPSGVATDFALEMINAGKLDLADGLLQLSESLDKVRDEYTVATGRINQAQLCRHKNEPVPDILASQLREMVANPNMLEIIRMGAAIVLEDWQVAEANLLVASKTMPRDVALLPTWPIYKLFEPHIQNSDLRAALTGIRAEYMAGRSEKDSRGAVNQIIKLIGVDNK